MTNKKASNIRKIKAYHQILGPGVLDEILEAGVILPAAYRLDTSTLKAQCSKMLEELKAKEPDGDPEGFRAIEGKIDDSISEIEGTQERAGILGTQKNTALECQDIMFGDAARIFLSPGSFRLKGSRTGLVFNAYDLVTRGATLRGCDYINLYQEVIDGALYGDESLPDDYGGWDRFEELSRMAEERASSSSDVAYLDIDQANTSEIVWEGPLPVEWAIEEVRNGRVRRLR